MTPSPLLIALFIAWIGGEVWISRRLRSDDRGEAHDRGSLFVLLLVGYTSLAVGIAASFLDTGRISTLAVPLSSLGLAVMAGGIALRWWSIVTLRHFFTVHVALHPDHQLIRSGPYRLLRHPSYTGTLVTSVGFAFALDNAWSLLAMLLPMTLALLWRIRIEERVLVQAFPDAYPAYARSTKRLVPFIW
jgi:protein-S-isoprenylcysteine O-methyltransferase